MAAREVGGAQAGEAGGTGFDHGAGAVAAQGALLLQVGLDLGQLFVGRGIGETIPSDNSTLTPVFRCSVTFGSAPDQTLLATFDGPVGDIA